MKSTSLTVERSASGRIVAVHVPMRLDSDPAWYHNACDLAGIGFDDTYRVRASGFLTRGQSNGKLAKSDKRKTGKRYLSAILHLAPHRMSGFQVCAMAKNCSRLCVGFNGKGQLENSAFAAVDDNQDAFLEQLVSVAIKHNVHAARLAKTRLFFIDRDLFGELLRDDITRFENYCAKQNAGSAIRPNGTSDINWEDIRFVPMDDKTIFEFYPNTRFYDYTKIFIRARRRLVDADWPTNYHLTFSRDESNHKQALRILEMGGNIAAVVRTSAMAKSWGGHLAKLGRTALWNAQRNGINGIPRTYRISNADRHDQRFRDPKNSVQALYAKGRASRDNSGFAIILDN